MTRRASAPVRRRASVVIEFALTLPILMVILGTVLDYGWYFFVDSAVVNAVKDGVRLGVRAGYGEDPRPLASQGALDVLSDAGLPCDAACTVVSLLVVQDGYQTLSLQVIRPFEPMVGLIPTPASTAAVFDMHLEHQDMEWYGF